VPFAACGLYLRKRGVNRFSAPRRKCGETGIFYGMALSTSVESRFRNRIALAQAEQDGFCAGSRLLKPSKMVFEPDCACSSRARRFLSRIALAQAEQEGFCAGSRLLRPSKRVFQPVCICSSRARRFLSRFVLAQAEQEGFGILLLRTARPRPLSPTRLAK